MLPESGAPYLGQLSLCHCTAVSLVECSESIFRGDDVTKFGWLLVLPVMALLFAYQSSAVAAISRDQLVGAWVTQGVRCREDVLVFLPDGRAYAGLTPRGFSVGGTYDISGANILTTRMVTQPAFRTNTPQAAPYETRTIVNPEQVVSISATRLNSAVPGNRNPDIIILPKARCPETPGVEPWFPKERYAGFAVSRRLLPAATVAARPAAPPARPPAGPAQGARALVGGWVIEGNHCDSGDGMIFNADGSFAADQVSGIWRLEGNQLIIRITEQADDDGEYQRVARPVDNRETIRFEGANRYISTWPDGSVHRLIRCP